MYVGHFPIEMSFNDAGGPIAQHLKDYYGLPYAPLLPESLLGASIGGAMDGFQFEFTNFRVPEDDLLRMHAHHRHSGVLPGELTSSGAFVQEMYTMLGTVGVRGVLAAGVGAGPKIPPLPGKQRGFERLVAGRYFNSVDRALSRDELTAYSQLRVERDTVEGRARLRTAGGVVVRLAQESNGRVLEIGPTLCGIAQRVEALRQGDVVGVTFAHRSGFDRELARLVAGEQPPDGLVRLEGQGVLADVRELARQAAFDTAAHGAGYAAVLCSSVARIPFGESSSVNVAKSLMAPKGMMVLQGAVTPAAGEYMATDTIIDTAIEAFGKPLRDQQLRALEIDGRTIRGREVIFRNTT